MGPRTHTLRHSRAHHDPAARTAPSSAGGTRRIVARDALAATRVIVLTTFERDEYVFEALHIGASGFLLKDTSPTKLLDAIRTVADGGALLSPSVTRTVIAEFVSATPRAATPHRQLDQLTDREREIVSLVAEGLSNHEIAERLFISPATARTHVSRAMLTPSARDRARLVVFAYQSGLVCVVSGRARPRLNRAQLVRHSAHVAGRSNATSTPRPSRVEFGSRRRPPIDEARREPMIDDTARRRRSRTFGSPARCTSSTAGTSSAPTPPPAPAEIDRSLDVGGEYRAV